MNKQDLIQKYNVAGPRYTSYPTVPYWDDSTFSNALWKDSLKTSLRNFFEEGISIYIHLPYCESLCTFCGCHKRITKKHSVEDPYIDAVLKEWQLYRQLFDEKPLLKELHLGGGTPTFFSTKSLTRLIKGILSEVDLSPNYEFGFEGHPNNTTLEHLSELSQLGFKRVSFGVQDYSPTVQKAINRIQPFENVKKVHNWARSLGYTSISHDLVFGLPFQTIEDIKHSIKLTNELRPDRLSFYSYAHVPWIKGVGQRGFSNADIPKAPDKRKFYELGKSLFEQNGYKEIGMDHFALESDSLCVAYNEGSLHRNFMGYTTNPTKSMIGLGMSAISDSWFAFAQNDKSVEGYIDQVSKGEIPVFRGHVLSETDLIIRKHILDLMCQFETTLDSEKVNYRAILERLLPLQEDGLLQCNGNRITVTELGKIFIRNICMCFDLHLLAKKPDTQLFSKTI
jgi:oxygen-independent coproporphyrinogen III oxidase